MFKRELGGTTQSPLFKCMSSPAFPLSFTKTELQVEDVNSRDVFPGAQVRVHSLQSALGAKLNGCEGVVESWNAATCRWQVRISGVGAKAIRDENLEPLNPGAKGPESGTSDTISIYRLLCQDGVTAVHETDFQAVVQRLLPQSQEQMKKLLYLQCA